MDNRQCEQNCQQPPDPQCSTENNALLITLLRRLQKEALAEDDYELVLNSALKIAVEVTGWDYAAVSRLSLDHEVAHMLSFVSQVQVYPSVTYDILGTPCQQVVKTQDMVFYNDLQRDFPDENGVKELGLRCYMGTVYFLGGKAIGHLFLMATKEVTDAEKEQANLVLQLLSVFVGSRVELISQYAELDKQREAAVTDGLTKLLNRRCFDNDLARTIKQVQSGMFKEGVLVLLDIDNLKQINDRYGHEEGDKLIKHVAKLLIKSSRDEDNVYRIGGDEFALLVLGQADYFRRSFAKRIEHIRTVLSRYHYEDVGISFGMSHLNAPAVDTKASPLEGQEWFNVTDEKLYQDKQAKMLRFAEYKASR